MINYRSRKGYKNLRIGFTRTVIAWENQTYSLILRFGLGIFRFLYTSFKKAVTQFLFLELWNAQNVIRGIMLCRAVARCVWIAALVLVSKFYKCVQLIEQLCFHVNDGKKAKASN